MKYQPIPASSLRPQLIYAGLLDEKDSLFNPSFIPLDGDRYLLTLRKICYVTKKRSQILCEASINWEGVGKVSNAREIFSLNGHRVRDMKLFEGNSELYATFNSGHPRSGIGPNKIFVSKLDSLEKPMEVVVHNRERVEKNWAFFFINEEMWAIYTVRPLVLLRQARVENGIIHMSQEYSGKKNLGIPLSIGSQPIVRGKRLIFTVHSKPSVSKLRMYVPRIATLDVESKEIQFSGRTLPYRYSSIVPSRWNPFALAVNYASGFAERGNEFLIGFGQADHRVKFGRLSVAENKS